MILVWHESCSVLRQNNGNLDKNNRDTFLIDQMAVNTMAEEAEDQESSNKGGNSTMKIVIIAVVLSIVLSGGIAGGMIFFIGGDDGGQQTNGDDENQEEVADAKSDEPPIYHSMDPKFVMSFRDQKKARFMQFSVEIMSRDSDVIKAIKQHNPVIRSSLLLLVDNQDSEKMSTREGKEQFLVEITEDINKTLVSLGSISGVEAAYYNSFVIQ
jgi:flagellar FliL protein